MFVTIVVSFRNRFLSKITFIFSANSVFFFSLVRLMRISIFGALSDKIFLRVVNASIINLHLNWVDKNGDKNISTLKLLI